LWLFAVAASAVMIATLWLLLSIERMGLRFVLGCIAIAVFARITRPLQTDA
jgi:hypothetical protein